MTNIDFMTPSSLALLDEYPGRWVEVAKFSLVDLPCFADSDMPGYVFTSVPSGVSKVWSVLAKKVDNENMPSGVFVSDLAIKAQEDNVAEAEKTIVKAWKSTRVSEEGTKPAEINKTSKKSTAKTPKKVSSNYTWSNKGKFEALLELASKKGIGPVIPHIEGESPSVEGKSYHVADEPQHIESEATQGIPEITTSEGDTYFIDFTSDVRKVLRDSSGEWAEIGRLERSTAEDKRTILRRNYPDFEFKLSPAEKGIFSLTAKYSH